MGWCADFDADFDFEAWILSPAPPGSLRTELRKTLSTSEWSPKMK